MGITLAIIGGLVAMTLIAGLFDYLGKKAKGGAALGSGEAKELRRRLEELEARVGERDERIAKLEDHVSFMGRLLEDGKPRQ